MFSKLIIYLIKIFKSFDKSYSIQNLNQKEADNIQKSLLKKLIKKSSKTVFGVEHSFQNINNYNYFKKNVPIRDYEGIKKYIDKIIKGEHNVLCPGKPLYFAKTSGTTSGIKYIPLTKESLKNQINSASYLLLNYLINKKKLNTVKGKIMFITGSPKLKFINNIKIGRLSGIVNYHEPIFLKPMILPSKETNRIENWEKKIDRIADETIGQDLRILGGIPPWIQMYFDVLENKTGKKIKDIFPNLELICHGGVNFDPYKNNLFNSIGKLVDTLETFPASEGFFAYQNSLDSQDLILQVNSGIFYEFIELDELNKKNPKRVTVGDVEINKNYAMIITTNAGLWSYSIGDTIKFTSLNPLKIRVTGRTKHYLSTFGEHIIIEEVDKALNKACKKFLKIEVVEYTVGPNIINKKGKSHHEWLIEFKNAPKNLNLFEKEIDKNLQNLNSYYKDLRKDGVLTTLKIRVMKKKSFINFMKSIGKLGGQNKVPRISNDRELIKGILNIK